MNTKFQDITKKPVFKNFYKEIGKLANQKKDKKIRHEFDSLINFIKNNRKEIINYFFAIWLCSVDDDDLKKEIIRAVFMNHVVKIEQFFEGDKCIQKISFEYKKET